MRQLSDDQLINILKMTILNSWGKNSKAIAHYHRDLRESFTIKQMQDLSTTFSLLEAHGAPLDASIDYKTSRFRHALHKELLRDRKASKLLEQVSVYENKLAKLEKNTDKAMKLTQESVKSLSSGDRRKMFSYVRYGTHGCPVNVLIDWFGEDRETCEKLQLIVASSPFYSTSDRRDVILRIDNQEIIFEVLKQHLLSLFVENDNAELQNAEWKYMLADRSIITEGLRKLTNQDLFTELYHFYLEELAEEMLSGRTIDDLDRLPRIGYFQVYRKITEFIDINKISELAEDLALEHIKGNGFHIQIGKNIMGPEDLDGCLQIFGALKNKKTYVNLMMYFWQNDWLSRYFEVDELLQWTVKGSKPRKYTD